MFPIISFLTSSWQELHWFT